MCMHLTQISLLTSYLFKKFGPHWFSSHKQIIPPTPHLYWENKTFHSAVGVPTKTINPPVLMTSPGVCTSLCRAAAPARLQQHTHPGSLCTATDGRERVKLRKSQPPEVPVDTWKLLWQGVSADPAHMQLTLLGVTAGALPHLSPPLDSVTDCPGDTAQTLLTWPLTVY